MEDPTTQSTSPARQIVGLFESSRPGTPERQDVEIASEILYGDDKIPMMVFDAAISLRADNKIGHGHVRFGTSFALIRDLAHRHILGGDTASLQKWIGGTISEGCLRRTEALRADPLLATHHSASAADHYADDAIRSLSALIGFDVNGTVLSTKREFYEALSDLPVLCFFHVAPRSVQHA